MQNSIANLAAALVKAQAEIEGAAKDRLNPHFKSKYADLSSVMDAIKPALAKHGLAFVQVSHDSNNAAAIETVIVHSSGETMSCGIVSVPVSKGDAQGFGSAMTYARRYSLSAAFGVAPEDDDGNAAAAAKPVPQKEAPKTLKPATFTQWNALSDDRKQALSEPRAIIENCLKTGADLDAWTEFAPHRSDNEAAEALWSCLDSAQRTRMTKAKEYLANQKEE